MPAVPEEDSDACQIYEPDDPRYLAYRRLLSFGMDKSDAREKSDKWAFTKGEIDMFFLVCYLRRPDDESFFTFRSEYWNWKENPYDPRFGWSSTGGIHIAHPLSLDSYHEWLVAHNFEGEE